MQYLKSSSPKTGVVLIKLNQPEKRNALNDATLKELADYLAELNLEQHVKAVVITGNAQYFAASADLTVQYAVEFAEKIAKQALFVIRVIKQSLKSIHEITLSQGLKLERQYFV